MNQQNPRNRDLSKLSELLAAASAPAAQTAPVKATKAIAPANDNKPARELLAWPAFERLARRGDHTRLFALRHWKAMCFPGSEVEAPHEDGFDPEVTIETRPSEAELLGAIGWTVVGRERWPCTNEVVNIYAPQDSTAVHQRNRNGGIDTQLGALTFRDGTMVEWGRTSRGRPLRPVERPRGVKGQASPKRSDAAIWSYLRLSGAVTSPLTATPYTTPMSGELAIGDFYSPLPREAPSAKDKHGRYGTREARALLRSLGIDGSVPFDKLPSLATRCPDSLVAGPQWTGGVKKPKPLGEISAAAGREPEFVRQVETMDYVELLRRRLGQHSKVLDLAITDATARQIGVAMGHGPAYAEKCGPSLIDAAIDALIDLDETARGTFQRKEEKIAA